MRRRCSAYDYDGAGRRTRVIESGGVGGWDGLSGDEWADLSVSELSSLPLSGEELARVTWTYDASGQLLYEHRSGANGYRTTYAYDPSGNRLIEETLIDGVTTSAYDEANRLLRSESVFGITTYSYDAAGNRRTVETPSGDVTTSTWNGENQCIQVELPNEDVVTYVWAPVNKNSEERIAQRNDGVDVEQLLWDNNNVLRETDDLGTVQAEYTYQPEPYGHLLSDHRDTESNYYRFDALGNTTGLTDAAGNTTDEFRYTAFGKDAATSGTTETPYRWIGQLGYRQDDATGLSNLRARDYDSSAGRFLSQDPIGLESGDNNFYRYVANSPTNAVDPSGLDSVEVQSLNNNNVYWALDGRPSDCNNGRRIYIGRLAPDGNTVQLSRTQGLACSGSAPQLAACGCDLPLATLQQLAGRFPSTQWGHDDTFCARGIDAQQLRIFLYLSEYCRGDQSNTYEGQQNWCLAGLQGGAEAIVETATIVGCNAAGAVLPDFCGTLTLLQGCAAQLGTAGAGIQAVIDALMADPVGILQCLMQALTEGAGLFLERLQSDPAGLASQVLSSVLGANIDVQAMLGGDVNAVLAVVGLDTASMEQWANEVAGAEAQYVSDAVALFNRFLTSDDPGDELSELWSEVREFVRSQIQQIPGELQSLIQEQVTSFLQQLFAVAAGGPLGLARRIYDLIQAMVQQCSAAGDLLGFILNAILELRNCDPQARRRIAERFAELLAHLIGPMMAVLAAALLPGIIRRIRQAICRIRNRIKQAFQRLIRRILSWLRLHRPNSGTGGSGNACGTGGGGGGQPPVNPCGNCFPAGTLVQTATGHVPIESLRVGQRVVTLRDDERELFFPEPESPIDPSAWQIFTVRQDQGEAGVIEADLLRPQDWFGVEVRLGERWELDLGELGLAGEVEIVAVSPCPLVEPGPGRVVLSTFRHSRGVVGAIRLAGGQTESLQLTTGHPVWSNTRANWASAAELQPGEELRTWQGTAVVESPWEPDGDESPVYNIEVDADHVFRVGGSGLLVHNASTTQNCCDPRPSTSANPTTLGINLRRGPDADVAPNTVSNRPQAHHIVAGAAGAAQSREILTEFPVCIGINDAINGVWLPQTSGVSVPASTNPLGRVYHNQTFTGRYYNYVLRLILPFRGNQEGVKTVLRQLRAQLASGRVNW